MKIATPVFERHAVQYKERRDDKPSSFRKKGSWFRGVEVDQLSLEEAREIAEFLVASAAREMLVSAEEAAQIKSYGPGSQSFWCADCGVNQSCGT
jgi:hypothetical protein